MRIACLQFAPQVGDVDNNLNRADAVLSRANPEDLDLLVLPELAFTGMFQKQINYPKVSAKCDSRCTASAVCHRKFGEIRFYAILGSCVA